MATEEFKVILVGDSGVGKTTFVVRYIDSKFLNVHETTLGVDCKKVLVDLGPSRPTAELRVWDTAGQERFKSIVNRFYRSADGIIIMYDVTCKQSFDNVSWWLNDVRKHCPEHTPTFLVGNKNENPRHAEVLEELVQDFADEHGFAFYKTSAKENINVDKVFRNLAMTMFAVREAASFSEDDERTRLYNSIQLQAPPPQKKKPCCSHLEWRKNSFII